MADNQTTPSLERQLAEAKAPPGSALEQLVKDNQDFSLLEPQELNDDVNIPLWLRVYWRKQHPDVQHSKVNPGAGYPDMLFEILEWMQEHPDLPRGGGSQPAGTASEKGGTR